MADQLKRLMWAYVRHQASMHMFRCAAWHQLEAAETERIKAKLERSFIKGSEEPGSACRLAVSHTSMKVAELDSGSRSRPGGGLSLTLTLSEAGKNVRPRRKGKTKPSSQLLQHTMTKHKTAGGGAGAVIVSAQMASCGVPHDVRLSGAKLSTAPRPAALTGRRQGSPSVARHGEGELMPASCSKSGWAVERRSKQGGGGRRDGRGRRTPPIQVLLSTPRKLCTAAEVDTHVGAEDGWPQQHSPPGAAFVGCVGTGFASLGGEIVAHARAGGPASSAADYCAAQSAAHYAEPVYAGGIVDAPITKLDAPSHHQPLSPPVSSLASPVGLLRRSGGSQRDGEGHRRGAAPDPHGSDDCVADLLTWHEATAYSIPLPSASSAHEPTTEQKRPNSLPGKQSFGRQSFGGQSFGRQSQPKQGMLPSAVLPADLAADLPWPSASEQLIAAPTACGSCTSCRSWTCRVDASLLMSPCVPPSAPPCPSMPPFFLQVLDLPCACTAHRALQSDSSRRVQRATRPERGQI